MEEPEHGFHHFSPTEVNELYWTVHNHHGVQYCPAYLRAQCLVLCYFSYILMTSRTIFLLRFVCLLTTASSAGKSGCPVIVHHSSRITRLCNWSLTWQMVFNTKKCHILSISRKCDRPTITYTLGTEKLSVVESYPYLGVTVSSDLWWHHHINTISNKATRTLNFIRRNIYGCSPEAKFLAYTSLVRPHLEYASAVWDPYTARHSNKLDKVQRRAARFVRRDYRRTTSASQLISE